MSKYLAWIERTYTAAIILDADDYGDAKSRAERMCPESLDWFEGEYEVFDVEDISEESRPSQTLYS